MEKALDLLLESLWNLVELLVDTFRCGVQGKEGFQLTSVVLKLHISSNLIVQVPFTASLQQQAAPEDLSPLPGSGCPHHMEGLAGEAV